MHKRLMKKRIHQSLNFLIIKDCKLKHQGNSFQPDIGKKVNEKFLYIDLEIHMRNKLLCSPARKCDSM